MDQIGIVGGQSRGEMGVEGSVKFVLRDCAWATAILLVVFASALIAPVGFVGGGWDDWQYLNSARCWREFGPCVPQNHWQGRWPVFVPIAALTALLGETRLTVSLWPLIAGLACLLLLAEIGNRLIGRPVGWIAATLFALTPAFSLQLLTPRAEAVELAFILGGALMALHWRYQQRLWQAGLSALLFSVAVQVRETAIVAAFFAATFLLIRGPRPGWRDLFAAGLGFGIPFVVEFIALGMATGDPFLRRKLSLTHTLLVSSELLGPTTPGQKPFFNTNYIMNWRHDPDVHVHWLVDGLISLIINAKAGVSLVLTPIMLVLGRTFAPQSDRQTAWHLYLAATAYFAVLTYVLAVDPKARMMFVPMSLTCLALGLVLERFIQAGRRATVAVVFVAAILLALAVLIPFRSTIGPERAAIRWMSLYPGAIEVDANTRRHLTLIPEARALPTLRSNRPYWIYHSVASCRTFIEASGLPADSLDVIDEKLASVSAKLNPNWSPAICLFRYRKTLTEADVHEAIRRGRRDGLFVMMPRESVYEPD